MTRLFEALFTTTTKGNGLRLALVTMMVRAHGGRIEVGSQPGHGGACRILLPRREQRVSRSTSGYG